jgi:hypothetical protein
MNNISMMSKKTTCTNLTKSTTSMRKWNTMNTSKFDTSKDRKTHYDKLEKRVKTNFKEREKEILAKLKDQPKEVKGGFKKAAVKEDRRLDETYFFDKERNMLKIRDHYVKRSLTPTGYDGNYMNLYKVRDRRLKL